MRPCPHDAVAGHDLIGHAEVAAAVVTNLSISSNVPASNSRSMRSRAVSLPDSRWRRNRSSPPRARPADRDLEENPCP